jgi:glycosyltransferase involved in cell wall biosynthesis
MQLVSSEGVTSAAQQTLFMPMMTRMPKQRVKMLVISLSPNAVPGAILRQNGVPVYDVALSKQRFSTSAFGQLIKTVHAFRPDVIQAWGHTAQIVSTWLQKRCEWEVKLVWSVSATVPLGRKPGFVDRQKLKYAAKFSSRAQSIVYTSEAAASAHRRAGFPEDGHTVVPLGVDPTRFKPDFTARRKVREQLGLPEEAFVVGMMAPFQPEYDYPTLLKAVGELIKTNPNIAVLLAGHGVQKGNAPLMALVGGGTLGTRTQLLGEWSDMASFFNACDLACSSALTDNGRMSLVMAMLCGVPCVATGMGAQGEVIGQYGVAVEPGSAPALIRGITRVMQLTPEKRVFMAQGARKHALANFVSIRSLQKYLQLYYDLVGRKHTAATAVPAPEIDATIPTPTAQEREAMKSVAKPKQNKTVDMYELRDPDSLESRDLPTPEERAAKNASEGDVLNLFESSMAKQASSGTSPMSERARGVADEHEDLLAPELLSGESESKSSTAIPAEPALKVTAAPEQPVQVLNIAKEEPKIAASTEKPKSAEVAKAPAMAAVATAPPKRASEPPKIELSLADTMSFSVQFSSTSTTGTLEIPADLIFTPAATVAPKPAATPAAVVAIESKSIVESAPATATPIELATPTAAIVDLIAPDELAMPTAEVIEPKAAVLEPAPSIVSAADLIDPVLLPVEAPAMADITADSSTVPALAVDALLSTTAAALVVGNEGVQREAIQLDLLGEPMEPQRVAAS